MISQQSLILDQLDVVKLDITLWTSSKKLKTDDLILGHGSELPPEELASLGSKKTIDPENLKVFTRLKKEAERLCLESGTRFLGGFVNRKDKIPELVTALDKVRDEFYLEKRNFLANYQAITDAWIAKHPKFATAIRSSIEPVSSVANKLQFDFVIFKVANSTSEENHLNTVQNEANSTPSLQRYTKGLSAQLFKEVALEARQLLERSFLNQQSVTAKSVRTFSKIRDKLDNLGFIDPKCLVVVGKIDEVLTSLPTKGPYVDKEFTSLFNLCSILSETERMVALSTGSTSTVLYPEAEYDESVSVEIPGDKADEIHENRVEQTLPITDDLEPEIDIPGFDEFLKNLSDGAVLSEKASEETLSDTESSCADQKVSNALQADMSSDLVKDIQPEESEELPLASSWF